MRWIWSLVLFTTYCGSQAPPYLRLVRDTSGIVWEEYYDEVTEHFYYYNAHSGQTSWMITTDTKAQLPKANFTASYLRHARMHENKESSLASIFNQRSFASANPLIPADSSTLANLVDVAGYVRLYSFATLFDTLSGVQARRSFTAPLKTPISFHSMFYDASSRKLIIAEERHRLESDILRNSSDVDAWILLGHVWRVYGDVHRAMDCYRFALHLQADLSPVLCINLAILLDQMNYVDDAISVLNTMMDSHDVQSEDLVNSFALGHIVLAQLHLRNNNLNAAHESLRLSIDLQQHRYEEILAPLQEIHYRNTSFGGPDWVHFSQSNTINKDPWLMWWPVFSLLRLLGFTDFDQFAPIFRKYGVILLFLRKLINLYPGVLCGVLVRDVMHDGPTFKFGGAAIYYIFPMICLNYSVLASEFSIMDCFRCMIIGFILSYEFRPHKVRT